MPAEALLRLCTLKTESQGVTTHRLSYCTSCQNEALLLSTCRAQKNLRIRFLYSRTTMSLGALVTFVRISTGICHSTHFSFPEIDAFLCFFSPQVWLLNSNLQDP
ncbi:hypothetical protein EVAR_73926_1 [Eumeta japonica]|uniref:Uncharacterized protein n=1 Tax=Eumeta variegata TaxID=151549 RepID=A0A4C1S7W3_EUMVA|nr:hypothetical protein EVAR_73926_1 [Eumeta japonica]